MEAAGILVYLRTALERLIREDAWWAATPSPRLLSTKEETLLRKRRGRRCRNQSSLRKLHAKTKPATAPITMDATGWRFTKFVAFLAMTRKSVSRT